MKKYGDFKLILIGNSNVGKTSFANIIVRNNHIPPPPTIGASFMQLKNVINDTLIKIDLWDTAGQERFRSLVPLYYKNVDIILLFFDTSDYKSFIDIKEYWINDINSNINTEQDTSYKPNMVLVENKVDKISYIPEKEIDHLKRIHDLDHFRISVKENKGVNELLDHIFSIISSNLNQNQENKNTDPDFWGDSPNILSKIRLGLGSSLCNLI